MRWIAAWIGLLSVQLPLSAGPPKKTDSSDVAPPRYIGQIDVDRIGRPLPGSPSSIYVIRTIGFSPDENWIAAGVSTATVEGNSARGSSLDVAVRPFSQDRLLLVPVHAPPEGAVTIDPGFLFFKFAWSPQSDSVLVEGLRAHVGIARRYNLRGEEVWKRDWPGVKDVGKGLFSGEPLGGVFGFLDSAHLLALHSPATGKGLRFETLDLRGNVVDTWQPPKHWGGVVQMSPDRQLLAVRSDDASKLFLMDYDSKRIFQARDYTPGVFFPEGGKTFCLVGAGRRVFGGGTGAFHTECWEVDTGKPIAKFEPFLGGIPADASIHSSRLVLTQGSFASGLDQANVAYYGGRVVWDYRSNEEVAAWGSTAPKDENAPPVFRSPVPGPVALSSSGHLVAEGADNVIRLYAIP